MRVGGGEARGRRLKGAAIQGVRPTTERVRAAIFNILPVSQYLDRRVLDLFAGTGSLGIEALSRGGAWADFVERDRRQCAVIRENLTATGYGDYGEVRQSDAVRAIGLLPGGYALALLDPPYRMGAFHEVMDAISQQPQLLEPDGMVVAGHSRQTELRAAYGSLRRVILRQYGDNVVAFYQNEPGRNEPGQNETSENNGGDSSQSQPMAAEAW